MLVSDRFRMLGEECSAVTAAVALREVRVLLAVAEEALAAWDGDEAGRRRCELDRNALARVVEILDAHSRAQGLLDLALEWDGYLTG